MAIVEEGDTIHVHYTGRLAEDETVFDRSGDVPEKIEVGEKNLLTPFNDAVKGMREGEEKSIRLSPEESYGKHNKDLLVKVDREELPDPEEGQGPPKEGDILFLRIDGEAVEVLIDEIGEEEVVLDANHPLAGKKIQFDIEVVSIEK